MESTPYAADLVEWQSFNTNIATIDFAGTAEGVGIGFATIEVCLARTFWSNYCHPFLEPICDQAPMEVVDPQPLISPIGVVEKNGLMPVTISVSDAGAQDTTVFRLRLASGTGNATFEDGTTQKSYTGNLSPTQLNIKGVTESSAANNYVMEALVNQTLHQPSAKTFTVAAITSLEFERINTTDVPFDNNPGTDGTHTTEEGLRVFPDKNTPTDVTDRATVRVNATIVPANVPNLRVYFASFDLDDPSAAGTPIDTTGNDGIDNFGNVNNSKSGAFSNSTGVTCANISTGGSPLHVSKIDCPVSNNTTSANFQVTIQPGDNFAVAASLFDAYRNEVRVNTSAGANLINTASQVIPISGEANPNNVRGIRTRMLTVWRRLHIEVDSMGNATGNNATGNFSSSQSIAAGGNTTVNVAVTPVLETNRFENGRLVVTSVNPQRSFNVVDHTPTVTANTANSVTIINPGAALNVTASDTFVLYDDDDFNGDDAANLNGDAGDNVDPPDLGLLATSDSPTTNLFATAYVVPRTDIVGGADANVATALNVVDNPTVTDINGLFDFDNSAEHNRQDFWTIYLLGGYQFTAARDGDPKLFVGGLIQTVYGAADVPERMRTGQGAVIFLEDGRTTEYPTGTVVSRASTVAHEVGHLFGCIHADGDIMAPSATRQNNNMPDICKEWIRSAPNP